MHEPRVVGVVLAAGFSRRMGRPKLLLPLPTGRTLLAETLHRALASCVPLWWVTVRPAMDDVTRIVEEAAGHTGRGVLRSLPILGAEEGMAASLRGAASEAMQCGADGLVVLLGDQPGVNPDVINRCVTTFSKTRAPVVRTRYSDGPGHPVLLSAGLLPKVVTLSGDEGARSILRAMAGATAWIDVAEPGPPDVDTPADYERLLRLSGDTSVGREALEDATSDVRRDVRPDEGDKCQ